MKLSDLAAAVDGARMHGDGSVDIAGFSVDSRTVGPGELFVALRGGEEKDRHAFIPDALAHGARAVLLEDDIPTGDAAAVVVPDIKRALAVMANRFYGEPWRGLTMIGVTGTSGKTTITFLIQSILQSAGIPAGRIGTHHNVVGGRELPSNNTTPFAHDVFRLLRDMAGAGDRAAIMEVTSHALALDRVFGIEFDIGLFSNITRDHLNFHKTEDAYFDAKAVLFERLSPARGARAIINADDPAAERLQKRTRVPVILFGTRDSADIRPVGCRSDWQGTAMEVITPSGTVPVTSNLCGPFNVSNLLAAVAAAHALGIDRDAISRGLRHVHVPGRLERVDAGQPFGVIVDFAHKPDALSKILSAARTLTAGRLISVFGCGGDRDRGKRPIMGKISSELADLTIVTSDNPRSEEPGAIIAEITAGIPTRDLAGASPRVLVEADRRAAIERAIAGARPGDVVVLAGKGDEDYQEIKGKRFPFDDKVVAMEILKRTG